MDIGILRSKNILSHQRLKIDFRKLSYTLFIGKTGAGKSSIFDILCLTLFGKTARKKYTSVLKDIPKKETNGWCKVDIYEDGDKFTIKRKFGRGKNIFFSKNNKILSYRTRTQTQEAITSFLGFDFDTFLNVYYYSQSDIGKFLSSDSNTRIKILSSILKLNIIDDARKKLKKDISRIEKDNAMSSGKLSAYINMASNIDVKRISKEKKSIQAGMEHILKTHIRISQALGDIKDKINMLEELKKYELRYSEEYDRSQSGLNEINKQIKAIKSKTLDIDEIDKRIKVCNSKLLKLKQYESDKGILDDKIKSLNKSLNKLEANSSYLSDEIEKLNELLELSNKPCPTCGHILSKESAKLINKNKAVLSEKLGKLSNIADIKRNRLKTCANDEKRLLKLLNKLKKYYLIKERLNTRKNEYLNKDESLTKLRLNKSRYVERSKKILGDIKKPIKNLKSDLKKYYKSYDESKLDKYQKLYDKYTEEIYESELKIKHIDNKLEEFKILNYKIQKLKKKLSESNDRIESLRWWFDNFPNIKLSMIQKAIPYIEHQSNLYLSRISHGQSITLSVDTDKNNNKLDVIIYDSIHNRSRIFEGWSGGEGGKLSLAICLALNKLARMRTGISLPFIILDEKFSNIDADSRRFVFDLLRSENKDRKILVISHIPDIESEFNEVIQVTKNKNGSQIERIK